jgi:tetratricopeptide (TPR) repeat protein
MLGDLLLELKRPSEAVPEYKAALKNSPNRFDSLYGAAHASELAGDTAGANAYYAKLMEISAPTADRAELTEAKSHRRTGLSLFALPGSDPDNNRTGPSKGK